MTPRQARRHRERDAREARARRLAYIGTLASGLAHEIRSPLNSIVLNADLLAEELGRLEGEGVRAFAERIARIRTEAGHLRETLDEFLTFARPPKMEPLPTDVNEYLENVIEFAEPECAERDIRIVREFGEEIYPVLLDAGQFRQVILNLLANAREAIGEHGEIRLATREEGGTVEIRISDNGGGVPEAVTARIFDVFFTTREKGTGLGLGIARRITEEHGGRLYLENRPDRGATFVVRLPRGKFLEFEES